MPTARAATLTGSGHLAPKLPAFGIGFRIPRALVFCNLS